MNQVELTRLQETFDKYDKTHHNSVDMWQLRPILRECGICLSDQEMFACLVEIGLLNVGELALNNVIAIIEHFKRKNFTVEHDEETYYAWIAVGGADNKSGYVEVAEVQEQVIGLGLEINIQLLLYNQIETRDKNQVNVNGPQVPMKLDYFEFKALMDINEQD